MAATVKVKGLKELQRANARADKEMQKDLRSTLRGIARPVAEDAQTAALREITNIGPRWSEMRVGVTNAGAYFAPKQRRRRGSPRPNLAGLLMEKAMLPALEDNADDVEKEVGEMLDDICTRWGRGA